MPLWLLLLALLGLLVFIVFGVGIKPDRRTSGRESRADRDEAVLEEAEREMRELGAHSTPEDADEQLPDWGPGAPKQPP